jgi:ketosteroid isomerase-like protein
VQRRNFEDLGDWSQQVLAREEESRRAFVARDIERLTEVWSDELLVNSPINRIHNKQQVLDLPRAGTIAHSSFDAEIEAVERRHDAVIVMGSESIVNAPGSAVITRRFTNVWRREGGSWRLFLRHANIVPERK